MQFSTSYLDGGAWDAALRLWRQIGPFKVIAAAAYVNADHQHDTPTANLGYAGVPAGFPDGASLGGVNANPSAPNLADVTPDDSQQFNGSFSVLHESGVSLTMPGGVRDPRYKATATELFFAVQWETLKRSVGLNDQFYPISPPGPTPGSSSN